MKHEKQLLHTIVDAAVDAKYRASIYDEHDIIILGKRVWLSTRAVVNCLHVTDRTLRRWVARRIIRKARVGAIIYYPEADLARMMNQAMMHWRLVDGGRDEADGDVLE